MISGIPGHDERMWGGRWVGFARVLRRKVADPVTQEPVIETLTVPNEDAEREAKALGWLDANDPRLL